MASPPFCTGYALNALLRRKATIPAAIGFGLSAVELLFLVALMVIGLIVEAMR
jgi:hypothetical protein